MGATEPIEVRRSALGESLGALADRLRVLSHAATGIAYLQGDREGTSIDYRVLVALADELERTATVLQWMGPQLCGACGTIEIVEQVAVELATEGAATSRTTGTRRAPR